MKKLGLLMVFVTASAWAFQFKIPLVKKCVQESGLSDAACAVLVTSTSFDSVEIEYYDERNCNDLFAKRVIERTSEQKIRSSCNLLAQALNSLNDSNVQIESYGINGSCVSSMDISRKDTNKVTDHCVEAVLKTIGN